MYVQCRATCGRPAAACKSSKERNASTDPPVALCRLTTHADSYSIVCSAYRLESVLRGGLGAIACTIRSALCDIPLLNESEMPMTTHKLDSLPQRPGFTSAMFSILCVAVVAVFVLPAAMSQRSHPQQATPVTVTDNELQLLLEARRDVLKEALESAIVFMQAVDTRGVEDLWAIETFQTELSKAELELAESKQDRIDVLTQALERISDFEEQLEMRGERKSHQLRIKAERLRIEIELHKVKKSP